MMHAPQAVHTFKFRLIDGTGGTYRTDSAKTISEAREELMKKIRGQGCGGDEAMNGGYFVPNEMARLLDVHMLFSYRFFTAKRHNKAIKTICWFMHGVKPL